MANLVAHMKEHLLSSCGLKNSQNGKTAFKTAAEKAPSEEADFILDCSVQMLKGPGSTGLSSRVSYYFPSRVPATLNDVFRYVDTLNPLLQHSEVFVVQDLDGNHSYYLRMDTVLTAPVDSQTISVLLDNVTQDVGILLQYFRYNITSSQPVDHNRKSKDLRRCG